VTAAMLKMEKRTSLHVIQVLIETKLRSAQSNSVIVKQYPIVVVRELGIVVGINAGHQLDRAQGVASV